MYYIIIFVLFFTNQFYGSEAAKTSSGNISDESSMKDASSLSFTDAFSVSGADEDSGLQKQPDSPAKSKLLVIAKIAEAKRRFSVSVNSMERSRRSSNIFSEEFDSQSLSDRTQKNSPEDKLTVKENSASRTPKALSETKEDKK